ncbi:MAG: hypothetical protein M5U14_14150 [Acidimicrobiia bacterium]|nr:hypothetical protein [Acidimicrobiia bacterium]
MLATAVLGALSVVLLVVLLRQRRRRDGDPPAGTDRTPARRGAGVRADDAVGAGVSGTNDEIPIRERV